MVIIISSKSDTHALAVLEELRQIDAPVRLLDLSDFPLRSKLSMTYTARNGPRFTLDTDTGLIDFSEVNSIWWRRPQQFQLDPCIQNQSHAQFAFNESQEAIMGLWQSLDIFWINDPARDAAAHRKAYQLKLARELGIPTPETLITNDPNAARQFIKMNEKSRDRGMMTATISPLGMCNMIAVKMTITRPPENSRISFTVSIVFSTSSVWSE